MEHMYSIMPLDEVHFDEIVADIRDQYERRISSCPLFIMKIIPEGDPVWNKVEPLCRSYARFRDALLEYGVPSGVLLQATFGHGTAVETPAQFQRMVGFNNGVLQNVYCPADPGIIQHLKEAIKRVAMEHPKAIMLDDDVRLIMRPFEGCACPRHMAEFNSVNKTNFTREELYSYVMAHPDDDKLTLSYVDLQRNTLVKAVTAFREAIDSVDPTIQGINCTSGDECDAVVLTNPIFAGKNNPTIVRAPNGTYAPLTTRQFSDTMRRAAVCGARLKNNGIDIVLAETDAIPFNRYAKNARYVHAHYTASLLDGLKGCKNWITRLSAFEPNSGKAFRNILAEHSYFYDEVARLSDGIRWVGANSAFIEQKNHSFHHENIWRYHKNSWATKVFERLGIPFYFSDKCEKATFLEGDIVRDMTDEQIKTVLGGSVFCSSDAAKDLIDRGYGNALGVNIRDYEGIAASGETFDGTLATMVCTKQKNYKEIVPEKDVEILSHCQRRIDGKVKLLFPAVTLYNRGEGLYSGVFCGTHDTEFNYVEGFSFLNESRKKQLIYMLKAANALPVYCETDNEMCMRAGYLDDGRLLCAFFVIGFDPEEKVVLNLEKPPVSVKKLEKDGTYSAVQFVSSGDNLYSVDAKAEPMYPLILIIE